jgi:hypothetical protein
MILANVAGTLGGDTDVGGALTVAKYGEWWGPPGGGGCACDVERVL